MAEDESKQSQDGSTISPDDDVYVFYCAELYCHAQTYMAVLDPRHGSYRPRVGLTQGWVSASAKTISDRVFVKYSWPYFFTPRGILADPADETLYSYQASDVRKQTDLGPPHFFLPGGYCPKLSILTFCWGGKNEIVAPEQWGHTGSSCSSVFIKSFIDTAVAPRLGRNYEVWTVYIEDATDLRKVADAVHLIFGPQHPLRRADHVCAMYFLYPTSFEENCVPTDETGEDEGAAHVEQKSFFKLMQAVERAGIPTRFPHPSGLYELLASKRWTHYMSCTPHLRVPPTVALPRMLIEKGIPEAAASALHSLRTIKKQQALLGNEDVAKADQPIVKGVAKLGFSWEALDVKFWHGEEQLKAALYQLTQAIEISQQLTGQPHDCESLLIQEFCEHDFELRVYVVRGEVEGCIYTKFCKIKPNNEFGDFHQLEDAQQVANRWMGGDRAAHDDGYRQCLETTKHWMAWIEAQCCDVPPAIRFDYFVGRASEKGKAVIWTLEICELGFSMLGHPELPRKVFEAMLHDCLDKEVDGAAEGANGKAPELANGTVPPKASPQQASPGVAESPAQPKSEPVSKGKGKAKGGPEILYVNVPLGSPDQKKCTGIYELQSEQANSMPLWRGRWDRPGKEKSIERWLYYSPQDQFWYVGDHEEKEKSFHCNEGYIRCAAGRPAGMPHMLDEPWELFDDNVRNGDWVPHHEILVAIEAEALDAAPPAGQGAGKAGKSAGRSGPRPGKGKRR